MADLFLEKYAHIQLQSNEHIQYYAWMLSRVKAFISCFKHSFDTKLISSVDENHILLGGGVKFWTKESFLQNEILSALFHNIFFSLFHAIYFSSSICFRLGFLPSLRIFLQCRSVKPFMNRAFFFLLVQTGLSDCCCSFCVVKLPMWLQTEELFHPNISIQFNLVAQTGYTGIYNLQNSYRQKPQ